MSLLLVLAINRSNGSSLNRLIDAVENVDRRRLVNINFNDKICVRYPASASQELHSYDGDYTFYDAFINFKPSYKLTVCFDPNNCNIGKTLSIGTDNKWYFNGQPSSGPLYDPACQSGATATPKDCTSWNPVDQVQPQITECGDTKTLDNGITTAAPSPPSACTMLFTAEERTSLTETDKVELLRQFNVQRARYGQTPFVWSPVQEGIALDSAKYCQSGHPMTTQMAIDSCVSHGGDYTSCLSAGNQSGMGPASSINGFLWDGYKNYDCGGIDTWGLVLGFMRSKSHRVPMTGEGEYSYTSVGCAYTSECGADANMYCNYM
eukprot:521985_1